MHVITSAFSGVLSRLFDITPRHTIIVGADAINRLLAGELAAAGRAVSLIDADGAQCQLAKTLRGVSVFREDATDPLVLRRAGASYAKYLLAATPEEELNLCICRAARAEFQIEKLIARRDVATTSTSFDAEGVEMLSWSRAAAVVLEETLPGAKLQRVLEISNGSEYVAEVQALSPCVIGRMMLDFYVEGCEVIAIRRGDGLIVNSDSTCLGFGDVLTVVGSPAAINSLRQQLSAGC